MSARILAVFLVVNMGCLRLIIAPEPEGHLQVDGVSVEPSRQPLIAPEQRANHVLAAFADDTIIVRGGGWDVAAARIRVGDQELVPARSSSTELRFTVPAALTEAPVVVTSPGLASVDTHVNLRHLGPGHPGALGARSVMFPIAAAHADSDNQVGCPSDSEGGTQPGERARCQETTVDPAFSVAFKLAHDVAVEGELLVQTEVAGVPRLDRMEAGIVDGIAWGKDAFAVLDHRGSPGPERLRVRIPAGLPGTSDVDVLIVEGDEVVRTLPGPPHRSIVWLETRCDPDDITRCTHDVVARMIDTGEVLRRPSLLGHPGAVGIVDPHFISHAMANLDRVVVTTGCTTDVFTITGHITFTGIIEEPSFELVPIETTEFDASSTIDIPQFCESAPPTLLAPVDVDLFVVNPETTQSGGGQHVPSALAAILTIQVTNGTMNRRPLGDALQSVATIPETGRSRRVVGVTHAADDDDNGHVPQGVTLADDALQFRAARTAYASIRVLHEGTEILARTEKGDALDRLDVDFNLVETVPLVGHVRAAWTVGNASGFLALTELMFALTDRAGGVQEWTDAPLRAAQSSLVVQQSYEEAPTRAWHLEAQSDDTTQQRVTEFSLRPAAGAPAGTVLRSFLLPIESAAEALVADFGDALLASALADTIDENSCYERLELVRVDGDHALDSRVVRESCEYHAAAVIPALRRVIVSATDAAPVPETRVLDFDAAGIPTVTAGIPPLETFRDQLTAKDVPIPMAVTPGGQAFGFFRRTPESPVELGTIDELGAYRTLLSPLFFAPAEITASPDGRRLYVLQEGTILELGLGEGCPAAPGAACVLRSIPADERMIAPRVDLSGARLIVVDQRANRVVLLE